MSIAVLDPNSESMSYIVDDSATTLIEYNPQAPTDWNGMGTPDEFQGTTRQVFNIGSTATFRFQGTRIQVFGTIAITLPQGSPTATFTLDNGTPTPVVLPNTTVVIHGATYYKSDLVTNGNHTLVFKYTGPGPPMFLDYFLYNAPKPTQTPTPISSSSKPSVGVVAGSMAAGFAVLWIATILVFFIYRRRLKSKIQKSSSYLEEMHDRSPQPFLLDASAPAGHSATMLLPFGGTDPHVQGSFGSGSASASQQQLQPHSAGQLDASTSGTQLGTAGTSVMSWNPARGHGHGDSVSEASSSAAPAQLLTVRPGKGHVDPQSISASSSPRNEGEDHAPPGYSQT